ncbi:hypothetical protein MTO96_024431 [Rhipicephalus appendiculatus]
MTSESSTTTSEPRCADHLPWSFPDIYAKHGSLVRDGMARLIQVPGTLSGYTFSIQCWLWRQSGGEVCVFFDLRGPDDECGDFRGVAVREESRGDREACE